MPPAADVVRQAGRVRDLRGLPKAHLHLHLTGGMRPATMLELARDQGRHLPAELLDPLGAHVDVTVRRGWPRFQRLYDTARSLLTGPEQVRRVVREIVEDQARDGVGWLELQVDPTTYAVHLGGLHATVALVLDELATTGAAHGVGTGLVIAANRTRHPAHAETLARLAKQFAGRGVVGFGLSNDETAGDTASFAKAFRLASEVGLVAVPHAGELRGPRSVWAAVQHLGAVRLGHGVRAVEDPALLELLAERQVVCEVCPASNDALGVLPRAQTPVVRLRRAGVPVALGADDPLLFRSGLLEQYEGLDLDDEALADLAACSIRGSAAPTDVKNRLLEGVRDWSAAP
jgi:adenosine deaminase